MTASCHSSYAQPLDSPERFEVVIRNGEVYDGSGTPPLRLHLGVGADSIEPIGRLRGAPARRVIDASGMAVAPGFINMLSWAAAASHRSRNGVADFEARGTDPAVSGAELAAAGADLAERAAEASPQNGAAVAASAGLESRLRAITRRHEDAAIAVTVIDPATGTEIGIHGDRAFHAASTMKVAVMIEAFRQADEGMISLDDSLLVENSFRSIVDGSIYSIEDDSDDVIYGRLGTRMSIRDLIEQMITVSSNLATNLLIDRLEPDLVQQTIDKMGVRKMRVLRGVEDLKAYERGMNNVATSDDLALQLEAIRTGTAVSPEADAEMRDVLLGQQFNDMIPEGLPEGVRVAHKTGFISGIDHDAAIVYPEAGESYVLVILTEGFGASAESRRVGAEIARTVHEALR